MFRLFWATGILITLAGTLTAQGYAFGIKGGPTVGFQRWDNTFDRDPLYRYHGIVFIESANEENAFGLFAQAGYHVKGSAIRTFATTVQTPTGLRQVPRREIPFEFRNISVTLGGKQKFPIGYGSTKGYYLFGIRGDYTISTQLRPDGVEEDDPYSFIYPFDDFVNDFNYGVTLGGGLEFDFTELIAGFIELTVNPDFSRQYNQPQINNIVNPNPSGGGNLINIPERQIINTTVELTFGIRFWNKFEYID